MKDYIRHQLDMKVLDIATEVSRALPRVGRQRTNLCAPATMTLSRELRENYIDHEVWITSNGFGFHWFIVVHGKVLDVTARQFGPRYKNIEYRDWHLVRHEPWIMKAAEGEFWTCPSNCWNQQETTKAATFTRTGVRFHRLPWDHRRLTWRDLNRVLSPGTD